MRGEAVALNVLGAGWRPRTVFLIHLLPQFCWWYMRESQLKETGTPKGMYWLRFRGRPKCGWLQGQLDPVSLRLSPSQSLLLISLVWRQDGSWEFGAYMILEKERSYFPQHPDELFWAILGLCTAPRRSHSGPGMKCHIDELESRQGVGLIDSLHRPTWVGSRAVLQGDESGAGLIKAIAVHSWVSLKGLESEFFHAIFNLRLVPLCLRKSHLE